jgi:hypothetical protein
MADVTLADPRFTAREYGVKIKKEVFWTMDYHEFDKLVNEHIKPIGTFEFIADEEANNDSQYGFGDINVVPWEEWSEWDRVNYTELVSREHCPGLSSRVALMKLCLDGVIPPGDYIIDVCW